MSDLVLTLGVILGTASVTSITVTLLLIALGKVKV